MNAIELIELAAQHGLELAPNGDKVKVKSQGQPQPELIDLIKGHKAELLAYFGQRHSEPQPTIQPPANDSPTTAPRMASTSPSEQLKPVAIAGIEAARERMALGLYLLEECVLIEEDRQRQQTARVWVDRGEWAQLCTERLKWSADDCQDVLLALLDANRLEAHHSRRAIRPAGH